MFLMTARLSRRRILAAAGGVLALVCAALYLLRAPADSPSVRLITDAERVQYLAGLGWSVSPDPVESGQVRIPVQPGEVFLRYNELQKSQGFDLSRYAGKQVLRCVYRAQPADGGTAPVHLTLLLRDGRLIGGDVTDTAPGGKMQPLLRASAPSDAGDAAPVPTVPSGA